MALTKRKLAHENPVEDLLGAGSKRRTRSTISDEAVHHILESLTHNYQNPIEGLVRETISNAIDATRLLPEDEQHPVEIITPSSYNMQFTVIDHGVGMDLETLEGNYVQYGRSLKLDDFSQTGSFGMGAKAPLAYTNEFKAVSVKDGTKIHFMVQRGVDGIWGDVLKTEKTDEPNGTTVTVALESKEDILAFQNVTSKYLKQSYDLPLIVDGKKTTFFDNYVEAGEIVMDTESGTSGRVWLNREIFWKLLTEGSDPKNKYRVNMKYLVTGWDYDLFGEGSYEDTDAFIELKPGLVNFNQSRDAIVDNERSKRIRQLVQDYMFEHSASIRAMVSQVFSKITVAEAEKALRSLNNVVKIRTPLEENREPITKNSVIRVREAVRETRGFDEVRSERDYEHLDNSNNVYQEFRFAVHELESVDGNAAFNLLEERSQHEELKYAFFIEKPRFETESLKFGMFDGGYGNLWNFRHHDDLQRYAEDDYARKGTCDPKLIPSYSSVTEKKGLLTKYGQIARARKTDTNAKVSHIRSLEHVSTLLAVVNNNGENAAKLLRQRAQIVELLENDGVTGLDGVKQKPVKLFEEYEAHRYSRKNSALAIAHVDPEDLAVLDTVGDLEVVIVNYDDLREDIRAYRKKNKPSPEVVKKTVQEKIESRSFSGYANTLNVDELLGTQAYTMENIASAVLSRGDDYSTGGWVDTEASKVVLADIQKDRDIVFLNAQNNGSVRGVRNEGTTGAWELAKLFVHYANNGLTLHEDAKIYFFRAQTFNAEELKFLHENFEHFYVSTEWNYHAKISEDIVQERAVHSILLQSALKDVTDYEIAAMHTVVNNLRIMSKTELVKVVAAHMEDSMVKHVMQELSTTLDTGAKSQKVQTFKSMYAGRHFWDGNFEEMIPSFRNPENAAMQHNMNLLVKAVEKVSSSLYESKGNLGRFGGTLKDIWTLDAQVKVENAMAFHIYEGLVEAARHSEMFDDESVKGFFKTSSVQDVFTERFIKPVEQRYEVMLKEQYKGETIEG